MKSCLLNLLAIFCIVSTAPSKPKAVYDQKQNGEHNIQVHLNDIQIVALLGEDGLGDYDYNYDYNEFTIKPTGNLSSTSPPSIENIVSFISTQASSSSSSASESTSSTTTSTESPQPLETTVKEDLGTIPSASSPDKIKVQIIEEPLISSPAIVPSEEVNPDTLPLGELVHYRRCATGFTRDKKGRCRRVRRPSGKYQFDIASIAKNFATRFRHTSALKPTTSSSGGVIQQ